MTSTSDLLAAREAFLTAYAEARCRAIDWLICADVQNDPEADDDDYEEASEDRWHCPVCVMNGILREIEPVLGDYIDLLERARLGDLANGRSIDLAPVKVMCEYEYEETDR